MTASARPSRQCLSLPWSHFATPVSGQTIVPPLPVTGAYPVACTNVEQDFCARSERRDRRDVLARLVGRRQGALRRRAARLAGERTNVDRSRHPATRTSTTAGRASRSRTSSSPATQPRTENARADYTLPGGNVIPKMQRGNEAPILPASASTWPVLLLFARLRRQPAERQLPPCADRVRVVGLRHRRAVPRRSAVFGVRPRFRRLRGEALRADLERVRGDAGDSSAVAVGRARPPARAPGVAGSHRHGPRRRVRHQPGRRDADAAGRRAAQLRHPHIRDQASDAGHARARRRRATSPTSASRACRRSATGRPARRACRCRSWRCPARWIRSRRRTSCARRSIRMTGPRGHVLLNGHGHDLDPGSGADIITWSLGFLAAWVNGDAAAKSKLTQVVSVEGGLDDSKVLYVDPTGGGVPPGKSSTRSSTTTPRSTTTSLPRSPTRRQRSTRACRRAGSARATRSTAGNRARVPATRRAGSSARRASDPTRTSTRSTTPSATRSRRIPTGRSKRSRSARSSRSRAAARPSTRRSRGYTTTAWADRRIIAT